MNTFGQHPDEGMIHAWLDDALESDEAREIESHVATCQACAAMTAEARGLIAAASRIVGQLDGVPAKVLPSVVLPSVVSSTVSVREHKRRAWWQHPSVAAAAVLLVATSGWLAMRGGVGVTKVASVAESSPVSAPAITPTTATAPAPAPTPTPAAATTPSASADIAAGAVASPRVRRADSVTLNKGSAKTARAIASAPPEMAMEVAVLPLPERTPPSAPAAARAERAGASVSTLAGCYALSPIDVGARSLAAKAMAPVGGAVQRSTLSAVAASLQLLQLTDSVFQNDGATARRSALSTTADQKRAAPVEPAPTVFIGYTKGAAAAGLASAEIRENSDRKGGTATAISWSVVAPGVARVIAPDGREYRIRLMDDPASTASPSSSSAANATNPVADFSAQRTRCP